MKPTKLSGCGLLFHVYLIEDAREKCPYCDLKLLTKEKYSQ